MDDIEHVDDNYEKVHESISQLDAVAMSVAMEISTEKIDMIVGDNTRCCMKIDGHTLEEVNNF